MPSAPRIMRALPTTRILWMALTISSLLMAFAGFSVERAPTPPPQNIWIMMTVMASGAAAASFIIPSIQARGDGMRAPVVAAPGTDGVRYFQDAQAAVSRALALGQIRLILSLALSEVSSLSGITLCSMGARPVQCIPFFAMGTLLMLVRFPTRDSILGPFDKYNRATFKGPEGEP